jgi:hypothetical protein
LTPKVTVFHAFFVSRGLRKILGNAGEGNVS